MMMMMMMMILNELINQSVSQEVIWEECIWCGGALKQRLLMEKLCDAMNIGCVGERRIQDR